MRYRQPERNELKTNKYTNGRMLDSSMVVVTHISYRMKLQSFREQVIWQGIRTSNQLFFLRRNNGDINHFPNVTWKINGMLQLESRILSNYYHFPLYGFPFPLIPPLFPKYMLCLNSDATFQNLII